MDENNPRHSYISVPETQVPGVWYVYEHEKESDCITRFIGACASQAIAEEVCFALDVVDAQEHGEYPYG